MANEEIQNTVKKYKGKTNSCINSELMYNITFTRDKHKCIIKNILILHVHTRVFMCLFVSACTSVWNVSLYMFIHKKSLSLYLTLIVN